MNLIEKLENKILEIQQEKFLFEDEYEYMEAINEEIDNEKDIRHLSELEILRILFVLGKKERSYKDVNKIITTLYNNRGCEGFEDEILNLSTIIEILKKANALKAIWKFEKDFNIKKLAHYLKNDAKVNLEGISPKLELVSCLIEYRKVGLDLFGDYDTLEEFTKIVENYDGCFAKDYATVINYKINYEDVQYFKSKHFKKNVRYADEVYIVTMSGEEKTAEELLEKSNVGPIFQALSTKHFELSKERDSFNRNKNKQIKLYEEAIKILNQMSINSDELIKISDKFYKKMDLELYFELMKCILEHNRKVYMNLQLKNIMSDRHNNIEKAFIENGLSIDELSDEEKKILYENGNIENIKQILQILNNDELNWLNIKHYNFVQVIINSNPEILNRVLNYIKSGRISKKFIQNNVGILLENAFIKVNDYDVTPLHKLVSSNMDYLTKQFGILDRKLLKNEIILLCQTDYLRKSLKLSKKYQLDCNSDNAKSYGFDILNHPNYFDYLDEIIELGYADYIKNNPQILRSNIKDIVARLSIMSNIGLEVITKENRMLGSITNGKNFYVGIDELKDYYLLKVNEYISNNHFDILSSNSRIGISKQTEQLEIVRKLDELFKSSELEYQINDNIISRIKFLRNIECLNAFEEISEEVVLNALIYNSVLDDMTIESLKNTINQVFNGKRLSLNRL